MLNAVKRIRNAVDWAFLSDVIGTAVVMALLLTVAVLVPRCAV